MRKWIACLGLAALLGTAQVAPAATLTGKTLSMSNEGGSDGSAAVGPEVEFTIDWFDTFFWTADFTDSGLLTVTSNTTGSLSHNASHQVSFSDLFDSIASFIGFDLLDVQNMSGFSQSKLNFSSNSIGIQLGDRVSWGQDSYFTAQVRFEEVTPVPLPAALPLFLAGLAGLGFVGWRKRTTKA